MEVRSLLGAIALWAGLAGAASAAVVVIADSSAANCSRAALEKRADDASLQFCNDAIGLGGLNRDDLTRTYVNRGVAYEGLDDEKSAYLDYQQALVLQPGWDLPAQELLRFTVMRK